MAPLAFFNRTENLFILLNLTIRWNLPYETASTHAQLVRKNVGAWPSGLHSRLAAVERADEKRNGRNSLSMLILLAIANLPIIPMVSSEAIVTALSNYRCN